MESIREKFEGGMMSDNFYNNYWIEKKKPYPERDDSRREIFLDSSNMMIEYTHTSKRTHTFRVVSEKEFKSKLKNKILTGIAGLVITTSVYFVGDYIKDSLKLNKTQNAVYGLVWGCTLGVGLSIGGNLMDYFSHRNDPHPGNIREYYRLK